MSLISSNKQQKNLLKYDLERVEFISDTGIFSKTSKMKGLREAPQPTSTI